MTYGKGRRSSFIRVLEAAEFHGASSDRIFLPHAHSLIVLLGEINNAGGNLNGALSSDDFRPQPAEIRKCS
jgi:hypothetical protein